MELREYRELGHSFLYSEEEHLEHHGVQGQKWGVRRYQNADGSLTAAGKRRYETGEKRLQRRINDYNKALKDTDSALHEYVREDAVNLNNRKAHAQQTLNEEDNVIRIGSRTIEQRATIGSLATLASVGSVALTAVLDTAIPLVGIPATAAAAGYYWYKSMR